MANDNSNVVPNPNIVSNVYSSSTITSSPIYGGQPNPFAPNTYTQYPYQPSQVPIASVVFDMGDDLLMQDLLKALGVEPNAVGQPICTVCGVHYLFTDIMKAMMNFMFKTSLVMMHHGLSEEHAE